MTTLCRIVLTVVSCTVDPTTPKPKPAEAVAIVVASLGPSRVPVPETPFVPAWMLTAPAGPTVVVVPSSSTAGPFGEFAPFPTTRRLDGMSLEAWPATYGLPFGVYGYSGGYGYGYGGGLIYRPRHGYQGEQQYYVPRSHARTGRDSASRPLAPRSAPPAVTAPAAPRVVGGQALGVRRRPVP